MGSRSANRAARTPEDAPRDEDPFVAPMLIAVMRSPLTAIVDMARDMAVRRFAAGVVPPIVLMKPARTPDGRLLDADEMLYVERLGDCDKEVFSAMVRLLAAKCGCRELVFLSEMWSVRVPRRRRKATLKSARAAAARIKKTYATLADHPQRTEVVMLRHETKGDTTVAMADVADDGGTRSLGPWKTMSGYVSDGPMARFMPAPGAKA